MNFVIVDNNENDLNFLTHIFREAMPECQIQSFTDPLLSAKYICNNPVDIVFLADTMRPVNGFRLLQVLRKNIPKIAIIMLSISDANREDAIHAGANDYLIKPVSADLLGGVVKQFTHNASAFTAVLKVR